MGSNYRREYNNSKWKCKGTGGITERKTREMKRNKNIERPNIRSAAHTHIYIYIYIERERERCKHVINFKLHIHAQQTNIKIKLWMNSREAPHIAKIPWSALCTSWEWSKLHSLHNESSWDKKTIITEEESNGKEYEEAVTMKMNMSKKR